MILVLDENMACSYGLDVTVFVTSLAAHIPERKTVVVEGWVYAPFTLNELREVFPWWTVREIRGVRDRAIEEGLLLQNCFNVNALDRTAWYAILPEAISLLRSEGMKFYDTR